MSFTIGHITVAGLIIFSGLFIAATVVLGIVYAAVLAFSGGDFSTAFFKFMAVVYAIVVIALIFGLVDLPCNVSSIPAFPNQWSNGCPSYSPPIPGIGHVIRLMAGIMRP